MAPPTITGTPVSLSDYFAGGPITVSGYTHASGDDVYVTVGASYGLSAAPTGVTWAGNAMTKIAEVNHGDFACHASLWRLTASSTTTGNVVVTLPGGADFVGTVAVFSGHGVSGLGSAVNLTWTSSTTPSVTLSGDSDSLMLAFGIMRRDGSDNTLAYFTASSNGTDIVNTGSSTTGVLYDRAVSFTRAGGASVAMTLTLAHASSYGGVLLGIPLQGGGGGGVPLRPWMIG